MGACGSIEAHDDVELLDAVCADLAASVRVGLADIPLPVPPAWALPIRSYYMSRCVGCRAYVHLTKRHCPDCGFARTPVCLLCLQNQLESAIATEMRAFLQRIKSTTSVRWTVTNVNDTAMGLTCWIDVSMGG
jgi:hypothetical protein